jgi:hypothetical protein
MHLQMREQQSDDHLVSTHPASALRQGGQSGGLEEVVIREASHRDGVLCSELPLEDIKMSPYGKSSGGQCIAICLQFIN